MGEDDEEKGPPLPFAGDLSGPFVGCIDGYAAVAEGPHREAGLLTMLGALAGRAAQAQAAGWYPLAFSPGSDALGGAARKRQRAWPKCWPKSTAPSSP